MIIKITLLFLYILLGILFVIILSSRNIKYGIALLIIFIILYSWLTPINKEIEGFILPPQENQHVEVINNPQIKQKWTDDTINKFIRYQNTVNTHLYFDINILQQQASEEEAKHLLETGKWEWSPEVKELYIDSLSKNPYIRNLPEDSLNVAMGIYNQNAILQVLRMQTKEGIFLLSGIKHDSNPRAHTENTYGYNSGLVSKNDTIIKCDNKKLSLSKIEYIGDSGQLTGHHKYRKTYLDNNTLESEVPGFHFINGVCNPCVALNNSPDYSCPFKLDINPKLTQTIKNEEPSLVWKYLWGLK